MTFQNMQGGYQKDKPKDQTKKRDGPRPNFGPRSSLSDSERQDRFFAFQQAVEQNSIEDLVKIERIQRDAALAGRSQTGDPELDLRAATLVRRLISERRTAAPITEQEEQADDEGFVDESAHEATAMSALAKAHHVPLADIKRLWAKNPAKYRDMAGLGPRRRAVPKRVAPDTEGAGYRPDVDNEGNSHITIL